jgi:predicted  nucleic acid-binding Zn-ribbon protein
MMSESGDIHYYRTVTIEQGASLESLRAERDEMAQRISELSAALELARERADDKEDAAKSLMVELDHYKQQNARLLAHITRIREAFDL